MTCAVVCLGALTAPLGTLLVLKWAPPPTTAFMIEHRLTSDTDLTYRWTDWDQLSPHLAVAVIASEDQRFFTHHGFDMAAIQMALEDARRGDSLRGASTISQQLAKNLFLWPGRHFVRKGLEAYLTIGLELLWSKRRILVYLNVANLAMAAASERFFAPEPTRRARLRCWQYSQTPRFFGSTPSAYVRERQEWIRRQCADYVRAPSCGRCERPNSMPGGSALCETRHPPASVSKPLVDVEIGKPKILELDPQVGFRPSNTRLKAGLDQTGVRTTHLQQSSHQRQGNDKEAIKSHLTTL